MSDGSSNARISPINVTTEDWKEYTRSILGGRCFEKRFRSPTLLVRCQAVSGSDEVILEVNGKTIDDCSLSEQDEKDIKDTTEYFSNLVKELRKGFPPDFLSSSWYTAVINLKKGGLDLSRVSCYDPESILMETMLTGIEASESSPVNNVPEELPSSQPANDYAICASDESIFETARKMLRSTQSTIDGRVVPDSTLRLEIERLSQVFNGKLRLDPSYGAS